MACRIKYNWQSELQNLTYAIQLMHYILPYSVLDLNGLGLVKAKVCWLFYISDNILLNYSYFKNKIVCSSFQKTVNALIFV